MPFPSKYRVCARRFLEIIGVLVCTLIGSAVAIGDEDSRLGLLIEVASVKVSTCRSYPGIRCYATSMFVDSGHAFITAQASGMHIIDVSDPRSPVNVSGTYIQDSAIDVYVRDQIAFVTAGPAGYPLAFLHVLDISSPASPIKLASVDLPDYPAGVYVADAYAFVADRSEGLQVIDVSRPSAPRLVGHIEIPGRVWDVVVSGDSAFVGAGEEGFWVVDVSDPAQPKSLAHLKTNSAVGTVFATPGYAFFATADSQIHIVDVAQHEIPKELSVIAMDGSVTDIFVQKEHLYAATVAGIEVLDISNPIEPSRVALASTPGLATSLHAKGIHVFVNDVLPDDVNFLRVFRLELRSSTN